MKQNKQFILSKVANEHILVPTGKAVADLNGIVSLNDMGVVIWNMLENDITQQQLLEAILKEYDVAEEVAGECIEVFLNTLREAGCLEE